MKEGLIMKNNSIALVGGQCVTMDGQNPRCEAILVEKGRIALTGGSEAVAKLAGQKGIPVVELDGRCAVPGLHDCHVHVMGTGMGESGVDLFDAGSIDGVLAALKRRAEEQPDGWIVGSRLDESRLSEKRPPTAAEIDAVIPDRGVYLVDRGLHYTQLNTQAYEAIGFNGNEPGVVKDGDGRPTGRVHGLANARAKNYYNDAMTDGQREQAIRHVAAEAVAKGVTTIHAMEGGALFCDADIPVFGKIHDTLPLDILVYWDTMDLDAIRKAGYPAMGTDILLDGSIGSRTAAFDEPYADDPTTCGLLYFDQEVVFDVVDRAIAMGMQTGFHSIGQRGIRQSLDALEAALKRHPRADHRYRVEHFGFPDESDIHRAKALGAIISTQPAFSYTRGGPGSVYNTRTGDDRERRAYNLRRWADEGLILCGGSDSSVTPIDPVLGIHAAVNPPYPENALTPAEALAMFTINGAYAAFEEGDKGSLTPGKLGDITVLSANPLTVDPAAIKDIAVEMTIVRGNVEYKK